MSYIEELKKAVSDAFKDASDKESIDKMVSINSLIASVESENERPEPSDVPQEAKAPDFGEFLAKAIAKGEQQ